MSEPATLLQHLTALRELNGHLSQTTVGWLWRPTIPFAVTMLFGPTQPRWTFDRNLLWVGVDARAGIGDITVRPIRGWYVEVALDAPSGSASFMFDREPLAEFVAETLARVPREQEDAHFDVDAELKLLGVAS